MAALINNNTNSLLERYINQSDILFQKLLDIPQKGYIIGEEQIKIEQDSKTLSENWENICNHHFIILSYAFNKGRYTMIDQALLCKSHGLYVLYPVEQKDVLYRFLQCRKYLDEYKSFGAIDIKQIFAKNIDVVSMLNAYTAFLILFQNSAGGSCLNIDSLPTKYIQDLECATEILKHDATVLSHYPQIKDHTLFSTKSKQKDVGDKVDITQLFKEKMKSGLRFIFQMLFADLPIPSNSAADDKKACEQNTSSRKDCSENKVFAQLDTFIRSNTPDWGRVEQLKSVQRCESADSTIRIAPFSFSLWFRMGATNEPTGIYHIHRRVLNVISERIIYAYLSALNINIANEEVVSIENLPRYINRITKGKKDDYLIFYVDRTMITDKIGTIDINSFDFMYLKGLPLFDKLRAHLLIVKRSQAPYLEFSHGREFPEFLQNGICEELDGLMKLSAKIDYGITVHFDSSAKVWFIKPKPMTVMYKPKSRLD